MADIVVHYNKETSFERRLQAARQKLLKREHVGNPSSKRRRRDDSGCSDSLRPIGGLQFFHSTF